MPALKTVLEKLDELPEHLHEFYGEKDGKFILNLEQVDDHPAVVALKNALERTKQSRKEVLDEMTKVKEKLARFPEDFDPDKFAELQAKVEEYEANPDKRGAANADPANAARLAELTQNRKMLEDRIKEQARKHGEEIAKLNTKIAQKDKFIHKLLIDEGLTKALIEAGVEKPYLRAAKSFLAGDVKVQETDDEKYVAQVETDTGTLSIEQYVSDWVSSEDGKHFVAPPKGADAGGSKPGQKVLAGGEKNPFDPKAPNLTQQGFLLKTDRPKAEKLARLAGVKLPTPLPG